VQTHSSDATMSQSNIEPIAREIAARICRQFDAVHPKDPPMTAKQLTAWVEAHWECAAAELEAGIIDNQGCPVPGTDWEVGLVAYRERIHSRIG
jgi:hypothetical protein